MLRVWRDVSMLAILLIGHKLIWQDPIQTKEPKCRKENLEPAYSS